MKKCEDCFWYQINFGICEHYKYELDCWAFPVSENVLRAAFRGDKP